MRSGTPALSPLLVLGLTLALASCGESPAKPPPEETPVEQPPQEVPLEVAPLDPDESLTGGATTVFRADPEAFVQPIANLTVERKSRFLLGEANFEVDWVPAPSSQRDRDGLGPLFHATSCLACHVANGRGAPVAGNTKAPASLLVRLSVPGTGPHGEPVPEPTYGDQFQPRAINGVPAEGQVQVTYESLPGLALQGEGSVALQAPRYALVELGYGPLSPTVRMSPRIAQPMVGLGLLAAIPDATLLAWADPDDRDGDGIRGRPNRVWSVKEGREVLGRFGWKANQPDLEHQAAGALLGDMGLTTSLFPRSACTAAQTACLQGATGGEPEVDDANLASLSDYSHLIAVPARRGAEREDVRTGKAAFLRAGCDRCHRPTTVTGELPGFPELSHQRIWPYTDLLLHDLGEALADGRDDFLATGTEWRTPPLWGLGLTATINGHTRLLHDGRARSVLEAILWHGGEATASREAVQRMSPKERTALLTFLDSL
ncbi:di-heme oxidoredictase family protein [Corallococcus sp. Z5C101001]|uniref:di-heme oxidoreductase family protein n=1 Tax=Corallococcus sp. Z5C101001 TaxID=2596829 RepID=UPI00117ED344|nr:di-heme oxidoredictase family protein [Corallococcus sp. Z5C101001]TSC29433.1 c-type cytochrome [Corallococcus sp. Z5C101001]